MIDIIYLKCFRKTLKNATHKQKTSLTFVGKRTKDAFTLIYLIPQYLNSFLLMLEIIQYSRIKY